VAEYEVVKIICVKRINTAFTVLELLVAIAVIGILAALIFPALKSVNRAKLINRARGEMGQLETCIDSYKEKIGYYPPDNRNPNDNQLYPGLNQLYYELTGTVFSNNVAFVAKDGIGPALTPLMVVSFFGPGVKGFVNTERNTADESSRGAAVFLKSFKPSQIVLTTISNPATGLIVSARLLACTVPGPDANSPPLEPALNPWRYNSSSPINNAGSYDLWTDIYVNGKTNRICNWSSKPLVVR